MNIISILVTIMSRGRNPRKGDKRKMQIMMKRKDGTITPFRNTEYMSAYLQSSGLQIKNHFHERYGQCSCASDTKSRRW